MDTDARPGSRSFANAAFQVGRWLLSTTFAYSMLFALFVLAVSLTEVLSGMHIIEWLVGICLGATSLLALVFATMAPWRPDFKHRNVIIAAGVAAILLLVLFAILAPDATTSD